MPQLPQVSHGDSSTRSRTVLLGAVTGVGVGEGDAAGVGEGEAAGVGVGTPPATVVVPVVPHETSAKVTARIAITRKQDPESAVRQGRKGVPPIQVVWTKLAGSLY